MKEKLNDYGLSTFKLVLTLILCLTGALSMIYVAFTTNALFSYFYCLATVVFAALPLLLSVFFRWKMNTLFYIIFSFYTYGPLLGAVYNCYYLISWWDILLHVLAGVVFAVVGGQFAIALNKKSNTSYLLVAIFGVMVSIVIAVVWEFFEYGCDTFLHSDMQADTIIHDIYTKVNSTDGSTQIYNAITDTQVNGASMGINGYLDIGLIDTMHDMLVETVGALVFLVYVLFDRNKHPMIVALEKKNKK